MPTPLTIPWAQLLGGLGQSLLGQNTTTDTNSSMSGSSTYTPTLDPATQAFLSQLMSRQQSQLNPVNISGYQSGQENQIGQNAAMQKMALRTALAARGLSNSPISLTAENNINNNAFQQLAQFRQSLPLLSNQLMMNNLAQATGLFSQIPKGATSTQQQTGQSTSTTKGGLLGLL